MKTTIVALAAVLLAASLASCSDQRKKYSCYQLDDYIKDNDMNEPAHVRFIDSCKLVNADIQSAYAATMKQDSVVNQEQKRKEDSLARSPYGRRQKMLQKLADKFSCTIEDAERAYNAKSKGEYFVDIGMGIDLLKYMLGLPRSVHVSDYGRGREYQACWFGGIDVLCVYYRDDGVIRAYN